MLFPRDGDPDLFSAILLRFQIRIIGQVFQDCIHSRSVSPVQQPVLGLRSRFSLPLQQGQDDGQFSE